MRTVTVLGAAGFLGSAITEALGARPIRLRAVARRPVPVPRGCVAELARYSVDVTDPVALAAAVAGSDVVVNVLKHSGDWRAAGTGNGAALVNVEAMRVVVRALGNRRTEPPPLCVYAGSVGQVGVPPARPMDGTETDEPVLEYDRQKLAGERLLLDADAEGVVRGVSLRLSTVYGQRSPAGRRDAGIVVSMARRALAGEPLTMWDDGAARRDLIHLDDVVAAFLAAIDRPRELAGRRWVLGSGQGLTVGELFRAIARSVATHTGRQPVPVVSVPAPDGAVASDMHSVLVDPGPFARACGWSPRISPLDGIDRTVAVLAGARHSASASTSGTE